MNKVVHISFITNKISQLKVNHALNPKPDVTHKLLWKEYEEISIMSSNIQFDFFDF